MTELILGIETSCDDTSVGLVARDGRVEAIETVSQYEVHRPYGGVYPELASRAHLDAVLPTIEKTLHGRDPTSLTAIAVTRGPGLMGSLLVGLSTAQALGLGWGVPVIGVNHLRGHLRSADLQQRRTEYPAIILLVSGGHSLIALARSAHDLTLLGQTRDDSVGESYDKVARMLGLQQPGGPHIDRLAAKGNPHIKFPRPMIREGYEFSFSGLKSSVARYVEKNPEAHLPDIAASFVAATLDVIAAKLERAIQEHRPACVILVGGVAASAPLRDRLAVLCAKNGTNLALPPLRWSTDNGAMIALSGWDYLDQRLRPDLEPVPNLGLETP